MFRIFTEEYIKEKRKTEVLAVFRFLLCVDQEEQAMSLNIQQLEKALQVQIGRAHV